MRDGMPRQPVRMATAIYTRTMAGSVRAVRPGDGAKKVGVWRPGTARGHARPGRPAGHLRPGIAHARAWRAGVSQDQDEEVTRAR
jgi:hypothetical protein